MSYKGQMDGWHGDEYECHGNCNNCNNCFENYDSSDFDNDWREQKLLNYKDVTQ